MPPLFLRVQSVEPSVTAQNHLKFRPTGWRMTAARLKQTAAAAATEKSAIHIMIFASTCHRSEERSAKR